MKILIAFFVCAACFGQAKIELLGGVTEGRGMDIGANLHLPLANLQELTIGYKERNTSQNLDSRHIDLGYNKYLFNGIVSGKVGLGGQWDNLKEDINPFILAALDFRVDKGVWLSVSHQEVFRISPRSMNNQRNINVGVKLNLIFSKQKPKRFF